MRRWTLVLVLIAIILPVSVYAADVAGQYDKATMASMSVAELESKANALRVEKDYLGASRLLEEAIRRQPKNAGLYNKLGLVELQLRDLDRAASHFNKAVKLNPKFAEALNNTGTIHFLRGNFDSAARFYRKALALNETRAVFHANLATTWMAQNKFNLALAEYARALELDPNVLTNSSATGVAAQVSSPEQRASRFFLLARVFAIRGDFDSTLEYLKKAKEEGYRDLESIYKQQEFAKMWQDPRLTELIPPKGK